VDVKVYHIRKCYDSGCQNLQKKVCLPDSDKHCTSEKQKLCDDLNEIVDAEYRLKTPTMSKKRKRGEYRYYLPQQRAKIARYAIDNGATKAARLFSETKGQN
jgi:hypothetical protein